MVLLAMPMCERRTRWPAGPAGPAAAAAVAAAAPADAASLRRGRSLYSDVRPALRFLDEDDEYDEDKEQLDLHSSGHHSSGHHRPCCPYLHRYHHSGHHRSLLSISSLLSSY